MLGANVRRCFERVSWKVVGLGVAIVPVVAIGQGAFLLYGTYVYFFERVFREAMLRSENSLGIDDSGDCYRQLEGQCVMTGGNSGFSEVNPTKSSLDPCFATAVCS